MAGAAPDISHLTDRELGDFIHGLTVRIAAGRASLESMEALAPPRKRTLQLLRSTALMVGGLFGAALDLWALVLTGLGAWDWIDSVTEDAGHMNRRIRLRQVGCGRN